MERNNPMADNPTLTVRELITQLERVADKDRHVVCWLPGSIIEFAGVLNIPGNSARHSEVLLEGNIRPGSILSSDDDVHLSNTKHGRR
jgi:hypothetical protein